MDEELSEHEKRLPWVWWMRDEPEDDLLGFHTAADRDAFSAGEPGPFRRRVCAPGQGAISQTETWAERVRRWTTE